MATLNERLSFGWSLYQGGNAAQAEQAYREVLREQPDNADVWCLLGIICRAQGHAEDAVASYREALRLKPKFIEGSNNLGNAFVDLHRYHEAVECYRQALDLNPNYAQAHNNLGAALRHLERYDEAVACYRRALELAPNYPDAYNNLGDAYKALDKLDEAVANYREAIRLQPNHPEAHNNLGAVFVKQGRYDDAIACHQQALQLRPHFAEAHNNLANAYLGQRRHGDAIAGYREALRLKPNYPEAYSNLGIALAGVDRFDEALACYAEALRLKPDYAEAHANLGNVYQEMGRPEEALPHYQRALQIRPDYTDGYVNRAQARLLQGKLDQALEDIEQVLCRRRDHADAHMGRALIWLVQGDFERGFAEYEWRWKCKNLTPFTFQQPVWDGAPLHGRTILLHAEQGLGDTLHFIRYAGLVKARGGRVIVACQKPLIKLLTGCPGIDQLVPYDAPLPVFDLYAPLLSLPRILGTTVATIPAPIPYVFADAGLIAHWQGELSRYPATFKIGVTWQGNPGFSADRRRSFPLKLFAPLAGMPGVQLFSLQKTHGLDQLAGAAERFSIIDLGSKLDEASGPFTDTAAVIRNLDLVIGPDTSICHLAGALGVPVWLCLSYSAEWRWLLEREDTPWYPATRLFRQQRPGDWEGVFERISRELEEARQKSRRRPITIEITPGELIDRLTVLEIESARNHDETKRRAVDRELAALVAARERALPVSPALDGLIAEMKALNESCRQAEEDLRRCESARDFGPRFVELARSGARGNERRAALKRRLDELFGAGYAENNQVSMHSDSSGDSE
ncbi:MAG TPA: tetratricopeptide repeat protein [Gemmataceae bacterium]|jgi:tetratricopeptide (TPR) repeat protein|nr:tetratricopeptide repeat protein [Gemmataceae bacterium]